MKNFTKVAVGIIALGALSGVSFADYIETGNKVSHTKSTNVFLDFSKSVEESIGIFDAEKRKEFDALREERISRDLSPHTQYKRDLAIQRAKERAGK